MRSFTADARIVAQELDAFYRESAEGRAPVIRQEPMAGLIRDMDLAGHAARGDLSGETLGGFVRRYLSGATRLHHPAYMAHQVAVPDYAGSLGALIDGFTNNAMAIYEMGPAAAAIEFFVLDWMIRKVGWTPAPVPGGGDGHAAAGGNAGTGAGPRAAGVLTHGGSLANLTALLAARGRAAPRAWEEGTPADLALLAPAESHYSIARAAGILGIGARGVYPLDVDARGVVLPDRIPRALERVRSEGRRPLALVANACSTGLGLYDPLREIAAACRQAGVWLHVDGAHGASALLSPRHRALLDGLDEADSVVWDAHKLLRAPTLCAAVLVRDGRDLDGAFEQEASYLFHEKEQPGFDFIHRTVECTKAGLGLRFYAVLGALGEKGLAEYVERQFALARDAHALLSGTPGFECPVAPQANILCFRLAGSDALQLAVRDELIAEGSFYLSTAAIGGRRFLRIAFMNPLTTLADVERLARRAGEAAARHAL
jgi:L-2,4-diaminobutyrate decarboxylase